MLRSTWRSKEGDEVGRGRDSVAVATVKSLRDNIYTPKIFNFLSRVKFYSCYISVTRIGAVETCAGFVSFSELILN